MSDLVDTHCHIHSHDYSLPVNEVVARAQAAGVTRLICVGTDAADSVRAVDFAQTREGCWASIGIHPHEALHSNPTLATLQSLATKPKVVAVGECGLDYFYQYSPKADQKRCLRAQIELALQHSLPMIFHVREAFKDFWPIVDEYRGLRGVIHSFTDTRTQLDEALSRGFYIGVNGIMTFTKNEWQLEAARAIPLERLLLETDAPFLTPVPLRGKVNEPAHVIHIVSFLANLRGISPQEIAGNSTHNALTLFSL